MNLLYQAEDTASDYIYSFWNTKPQILLENHVVFPGGELKIMDPSRTFDFNDLEEGLTFQGDIVEVVGERDSTENQETDDVSHTLKIDYPNNRVETIQVEEEQEDGSTIIVPQDIYYPVIHVFHEPWRCSIIVGEYSPDLYQLSSSSWSVSLLKKWKIGLDNGNLFSGNIEATSLSGVSIQSENLTTMEYSSPNIEIGRIWEDGFSKDAPRTTSFTDKDAFDKLTSPKCNFYFLRLSIEIDEMLNVEDYPESFTVRVLSLQHHCEILDPGTTNPLLVCRDIELKSQGIEDGIITYLSEDYRIMFMDYNSEGGYSTQYLGEPQSTDEIKYVQFVLLNGLAFEIVGGN